MRFTKLKNFSNGLLALLLPTLLIAITGCSWFGNTAPKKLTGDYHEKIFRLDAESENIRADLQKVSSDTFSYFEVNETTATCEILVDAKKRAQCYDDFYRLKTRKK